MASRYWVGGTGPWNTSTARWSATSGGGSGASVPTSADAVFFDASSGGGTATITSTSVCQSLTYTGFTGTLAFGTNFVPVHGTGTVVATADATTLTSITGSGGCELVLNTASSRTVSLVTTVRDKRLNVKVSAGSGTVVATGRGYAHLEFTSGFSGSLANGTRDCRSLTISSSMTTATGVATTTVGGSSFSPSGNTITTNGVTLNFQLEVGDSGFYPVELAGALTLGSAYLIDVRTCDFITNDYSITAEALEGRFSSPGNTLNLGASVITLSGSGTVWDVGVTTTTVNAGTSVISLTSASAKTFIGEGKTYSTLRQGGAGMLTITGSNTFGDITNSVNGSTVRLTAGTTQTVSAFTLSGASGNLTTLDTTSAGSAATLSKSSGTVTANYLSIKDSTATGGATWFAGTGTGSVDVSGNTGWNFGSLPSSSATFLQLF